MTTVKLVQVQPATATSVLEAATGALHIDIPKLGSNLEVPNSLYFTTINSFPAVLTNLPASGTVTEITSTYLVIGGKRHWLLPLTAQGITVPNGMEVPAGETVILSGSPKLYSGRIYGAGQVVGVVADGSNLNVLDIKSNVVFASDRKVPSVSYTYSVDPMGYGDYMTLEAALVKVKSDVASGSTGVITLLLRGGRHEINPLTLDSSYLGGQGVDILIDSPDVIISESTFRLGSTYSGGVNFVGCAGEKPVITPVMDYVSGSNSTVYSGTHKRVPNSLGRVALKAFNSQLQPIEVSSNYNRVTGKLPRQQNQRVGNVAGTNGFFIKPTAADRAGLAGEQLSSVALRINQNYSSSWNDITSLESSGNLYYTAQGPYTTSPTGLYFDGYYYVTGFSAPYWLRNAKYLLESDTFCADSAYFYLPNNTVGMLVPQPLYGWAITCTTEGFTFDNLTFACFDIPKTALSAIWSERFQNAGCLHMVNSTGCSFNNITAENITGVFMLVSKDGVSVTNFKARNIGCSVFITGYQQHSDNFNLSDFDIYNVGEYSTAAHGMYLAGRGIYVTRGTTSNTSFAGVATDATWQDSDPSRLGAYTSGSFSDINIVEVGKRDAIISDLHSASDFGALNCNAKTYSVGYTFERIYVSDVQGAALVRGLFLDDGVNGYRITDSVIANVDGEYALDARQVNGGTYNNTFTNMLVIGNVRLHSLTNTSRLTGSVSGASPNLDTFGTTAYTPARAGFSTQRRGTYTTVMPYVYVTSNYITSWQRQFVTGNSLFS